MIREEEGSDRSERRWLILSTLASRPQLNYALCFGNHHKVFGALRRKYKKRRIGITYHSVSDCSLFVVISYHGANLVIEKKRLRGAKSSREKKNREDLFK